jgi:hypothetical protein
MPYYTYADFFEWDEDEHYELINGEQGRNHAERDFSLESPRKLFQSRSFGTASAYSTLSIWVVFRLTVPAVLTADLVT